MHSRPVALRPFDRSDVVSLRSWVHDADELHRFSGGSLTWPLDEAQLHRLRERPDTDEWTAITDDGSPFGHLATVWLDAERARIARVLIAPAFRGQRLGRPMIEAAIRMLHERGRTDITLHVVPGNDPALRTYLSVGFEQVASDPAHPEFIRMRLLTTPSRSERRGDDDAPPSS